MNSLRSVRFRISVQYSAVVFGLGGAILGLIYLVVRNRLQVSGTPTTGMSGRTVLLDTGELVTLPEMSDLQVRAVETLFRDSVLAAVGRYSVIALVALFFLSLAVGWIMSGRVLRPIDEITALASRIQAFDLSGRIGLQGPDDELKRLADTFDRMLDRLDRAFTSQRRFLADTSHDLRTPLTVIRSNVELVSEDPDATVEDWKRAGEIIQRNAEKMSRMIDDLLAAARLQAGKAQAVTLDLEDIVLAKADEYAPVAEDAGLQLRVVSSSVTVDGVEMSLDRALTNLLDNARKVAPPGSTITLGCGRTGDWAWLAVADQGPGLSDDISQIIGLGLSIVFGIAEGHGGTVTSYPNKGGGTVMVVWIPLVEHPGNPPRTSPLEPLTAP
ncbi:MAG: HAMP domain-containing sensor histidine kinase [Actinomycetes bacterium]|jgi:signal transduction histidine kinase